MDVLKLFELLKKMISFFSTEKTRTEGGNCIVYAPNSIGDDEFLAAEYVPM